MKRDSPAIGTSLKGDFLILPLRKLTNIDEISDVDLSSSPQSLRSAACDFDSSGEVLETETRRSSSVPLNAAERDGPHLPLGNSSQFEVF